MHDFPLPDPSASNPRLEMKRFAPNPHQGHCPGAPNNGPSFHPSAVRRRWNGPSLRVGMCAGIGADDMFQLLTAWRATSARQSAELRLAVTLRSAAVAITITSLAELLAFCIGATSPFLGVRNFCACSGMVFIT